MGRVILPVGAIGSLEQGLVLASDLRSNPAVEEEEEEVMAAKTMAAELQMEEEEEEEEEEEDLQTAVVWLGVTPRRRTEAGAETQ